MEKMPSLQENCFAFLSRLRLLKEMYGSPTIETDPPILVVDDDPVVRRGTEMLLRSWKYRAICAADAESALRSLSLGLRPELALLDVDLGPGIDGIELCRTLLVERQIPVIFQTSRSDEETIRRARSQTNYCGLLSKRNDSTALRSMVELALKAKSMLQQIQQDDRRIHLIGSVLSDAMVCTDSGGNVTWSNEQAEYVAGQSLKNQNVGSLRLPKGRSLLRIPVKQSSVGTLYRLQNLRS